MHVLVLFFLYILQVKVRPIETFFVPEKLFPYLSYAGHPSWPDPLCATCAGEEGGEHQLHKDHLVVTLVT